MAWHFNDDMQMNNITGKYSRECRFLQPLNWCLRIQRMQLMYTGPEYSSCILFLRSLHIDFQCRCISNSEVTRNIETLVLCGPSIIRLLAVKNAGASVYCLGK